MDFFIIELRSFRAKSPLLPIGPIGREMMNYSAAKCFIPSRPFGDLNLPDKMSNLATQNDLFQF